MTDAFRYGRSQLTSILPQALGDGDGTDAALEQAADPKSFPLTLTLSTAEDPCPIRTF